MKHRHGGSCSLARFALGAAVFAAVVAGCSGGGDGNDAPGGSASRSSSGSAEAAAPVVTFVELGSDKCVPCIQMRPVMEEIESQYGHQVRVVFHDVWTDEGAPYARQYRIRVIPTQVFLDAQGREYYRHEGYFPTAEVVKILALQGVKKR